VNGGRAWPRGTVAVLATTTAEGAPHAIPVSAVLRDGDDDVLLGLAARRAALAHLADRPAAALCVMARGLAVTLHGTARVLGPLPGAERVVGVRLAVAREQHHLHPEMTLESGVRWAWTTGRAAARDGAVLAALRALARG
jgi:predicted pyridoxine 5'-phosphate oxidase superfamily flavin-nucleotide-binding protein